MDNCTANRYEPELGAAVKRYLVFLAGHLVDNNLCVGSRNQVVARLLPDKNPPWQELQKHQATKVIIATMVDNSGFQQLYSDYIQERQDINKCIAIYADEIALEMVIQLAVRLSESSSNQAVESLVNDFQVFVEKRALSFISMAPLFNFMMNGKDIFLDEFTRISEMNDQDKIRTWRELSNPDIIHSQNMLEGVKFAIYQTFHVPVSSRNISPPDENLAMDANLVLRLIEPNKAVNSGYLAHWTTGWHRFGFGASGVALEFRWAGPTCVFDDNKMAAVPLLWQEVRRLLAANRVRSARFFNTALNRLIRAGHEQNVQQRLLDLFISIDSLVLQPDERWATRNQKLGPSRVGMILSPSASDRRLEIVQQCRIARKQRDTITHGVDRPLVGLDGNKSTFVELVVEAQKWTSIIVVRILRLLEYAGSLKEAHCLLDRAENDAGSREAIARVVELK